VGQAALARGRLFLGFVLFYGNCVASATTLVAAPR
jgi:hypothetical protein